MSTSISFIVGKNASGKSKFAEDTIEILCKNPVYIGTLKNTIENEKRILKHKNRRGENWKLIEIHTPIELLTLISFEKPIECDGILLDGLTNFFWNCTRTHGLSLQELWELKNSLFTWLAELKKMHLFIVDCAIPFPELSNQYWFNKFIKEVQTELIFTLVPYTVKMPATEGEIYAYRKYIMGR